jgi:hypothetical protein
MLHEGTEEKLQLVIRNLHGQEMVRRTIAQGNEAEIKFDVSNLAPGIYFLEYRSGEKRKVMVN